MDSEVIQAAVDGIRFADWINQRGCAKSTAYRMRTELGITPTKHRHAGRLEVWLSAADAALMDQYADALAQGHTTMAALDIVGRPMEPDGPAPLVPMEPDGSLRPGPMEPDGVALLRRLEAAERAIRSGLGMTTSETSWVLGVRPGSSPLTRGGVIATRTGFNCWVLERYSPSSSPSSR